MWRATTDGRGSVVVEIASVWAVGARAEAEVYAEMTRRVERLPDSPPRLALTRVIAELGKRVGGVVAAAQPATPSRPEQWLVDRLVFTAGSDRALVEAMTSEQAVDALTEFVSRPL